MLVRCLYASRSTAPLPEVSLDAILRHSRRNNTKQGITGMLCYTDGVFVQLLEGGRAEVSRLLGTIYRDERHQGVEILAFDEINERRFGNWTMGQVNLSLINPAMLLKYSEKAELNPFASPGLATLSLLNEIADSGAIISRPG